MTAKEERAINLEIHRMNRAQTEMIARNAALEAECARLRGALRHEAEKHAAMGEAVLQQCSSYQRAEQELVETMQREREDMVKQMQQDAAAQIKANADELIVMKRAFDAHYAEIIDSKVKYLDAVKKEREDMLKQMQQDAAAQKQANADELSEMKRNLYAHYTEIIDKKTRALDAVKREFEAECEQRLTTDRKERAEREEAQLSQFLARMEETNKARIEIAQELEDAKKKLAQNTRERAELLEIADRRFEEHVKTHTAKLFKTIAFSEISHAVAANYAHTQLIYNLDFRDKRVLIFSHYSKADEVESYNYLTLERLDERFDLIIVLTNCPNRWDLPGPNYNKYHLLSYNFKSDFRNYGVFIMQTAKALIRASQVCLMNDSFVVVDVDAFGRCMKRLFESTAAAAADFAGITSSHEGVYHLQSYFIVFNGRAVNAMVEYFKMRGLPMNHQASISDYELGITAQLAKDGLVPFAMVSNQEMPCPINTTYYKWSMVLQYTGIVKRQHFLKQYPARFAMTDMNIALIADKFSQNMPFIHFLKHHGIQFDKLFDARVMFKS